MAENYVIELDDRALALAFAGEVLSSGPSVVFDGTGAEPAGSPAFDLSLLNLLSSARAVASLSFNISSPVK